MQFQTSQSFLCSRPCIPLHHHHHLLFFFKIMTDSVYILNIWLTRHFDNSSKFYLVVVFLSGLHNCRWRSSRRCKNDFFGARVDRKQHPEDPACSLARDRAGLYCRRFYMFVCACRLVFILCVFCVCPAKV